MKPPEKRGGGPRKETAAASSKQPKPDALGELSKWLQVRWARHYVLFAAFGHEADQLAMRQLAVFLETLKGVQQ